MNQNCTHYTAQYLITPVHPVTISLIGVGGTGSQVLNGLARMDSALRALGHPGFHVKAFDPDRVSEANLGRQLFSYLDVGEYKANILVTRINRFYGLEWEAFPVMYNTILKHKETDIARSNLIISCVDTAKARITISKMWNPRTRKVRGSTPYLDLYYWLDFGNTQRTGQVILGTFGNIAQPNGGVKKLKTVVEQFPDLKKADNEAMQGPSCSLAEALNRQDLFINSTLANLGLDILWKMFRDLKLLYHGVFLNLETMKVNPLSIVADNITASSISGSDLLRKEGS